MASFQSIAASVANTKEFVGRLVPLVSGAQLADQEDDGLSIQLALKYCRRACDDLAAQLQTASERELEVDRQREALASQAAEVAREHSEVSQARKEQQEEAAQLAERKKTLDGVKLQVEQDNSSLKAEIEGLAARLEPLSVQQGEKVGSEVAGAISQAMGRVATTEGVQQALEGLVARGESAQLQAQAREMNLQRRDNERLESELERAREAARETSAQLQDQAREMNRQQQDFERLESELERAREAARETSAQLAEAKAALVAQTARNEALVADVGAKTGELNALHEQAQEARSALSSARLTRERDTLQAEHDTLKTEHNKATEQLQLVLGPKWHEEGLEEEEEEPGRPRKRPRRDPLPNNKPWLSLVSKVASDMGDLDFELVGPVKMEEIYYQLSVASLKARLAGKFYAFHQNGRPGVWHCFHAILVKGLDEAECADGCEMHAGQKSCLLVMRQAGNGSKLAFCRRIDGANAEER